MRLIPVTFVKPGQDGDFTWMADQPAHARTLFLFNDNADQFLAYQAGQRDVHACGAGNGNAAIRPLQCEDPPRAAGIPTGHGGKGYTRLNGEAKGMIDHALDHIRRLLETGHYEQVVYSCAKDDPDRLGTGIVTVGDDVARYVPERLSAIVAALAHD